MTVPFDTARDIVTLATEKNLHISTAESCTGGMVAAAITDVPGSSSIFERGFVTYSNAAKVEMIGVSQSHLDKHGAVSEPVVRDMATGALHAARANIAVSISGIAGPGGSEHKPEGRVCFGLAQGEQVTTETVDFGALGRAKVRTAATQYALDLILGALRQGGT
ncbi:MAG: CinA family protein [Marinovum sp.]|nr:CinA family protein [Marinovum sp.]